MSEVLIRHGSQGGSSDRVQLEQGFCLASGLLNVSTGVITRTFAPRRRLSGNFAVAADCARDDVLSGSAALYVTSVGVRCSIIPSVLPRQIFRCGLELELFGFEVTWQCSSRVPCRAAGGSRSTSRHRRARGPTPAAPMAMVANSGSADPNLSRTQSCFTRAVAALARK